MKSGIYDNSMISFFEEWRTQCPLFKWVIILIPLLVLIKYSVQNSSKMNSLELFPMDRIII
jgi:hypothetical protein